MAILMKEFVQMRRDRLTFAMIVGIPILQLVLFGYAINSDPKALPTAVVDYDKSEFSRSIIRGLQNTAYFAMTDSPVSEAKADRLLSRGDVQFAVIFPSDFSRRTFENLVATPALPLEVMRGKFVPYIVVSFMQSAVILGAARLRFDVPVIGSLALLFAAMMLYIASLLALGFTISTLAKNQLQAMQMTFFFFLPSLLLSGFMFPFRGMPGWAQTLGEIFPLTHFLRIVRGILLKGNAVGEVAPHF